MHSLQMKMMRKREAQCMPRRLTRKRRASSPSAAKHAVDAKSNSRSGSVCVRGVPLHPESNARGRELRFMYESLMRAEVREVR